MIDRTFPITAAFAAMALFSITTVRADEPDFRKSSYTYKTVGETSIQADVYLLPGGRPRPVCVWLHGGALIMGNRDSVPAWLMAACRKDGLAIVSFDYRLAPETKLPEISQDLRDAFLWLRSQGTKLGIDPDRMVVAGGSAGGYLTMLAGTIVKPRPRVLLALWGYGDLDWYMTPSEFYRTRSPLVTREEAFRGVGRGVPTQDDSPPNDPRARSRFYLYLRQNGSWIEEVGGISPRTEMERFKPFRPIRNLSSEYPPIVMIHGTVDEDVPYEQSAAMDRELARLGIPHLLIPVPKAGHGLSHADHDQVQAAYERAWGFVRERLQ